MVSINKISMATLLLGCATTAMVEQGGGATGRTLDMQTNQGTTAKLAHRVFFDASETGVRVSHRLNEQTVVYEDLSFISGTANVNVEGVTGTQSSTDVTASAGTGTLA